MELCFQSLQIGLWCDDLLEIGTNVIVCGGMFLSAAGGTTVSICLLELGCSLFWSDGVNLRRRGGGGKVRGRPICDAVCSGTRELREGCLRIGKII